MTQCDIGFFYGIGKHQIQCMILWQKMAKKEVEKKKKTGQQQ
jgi:hypothetical protein